MSSIKDISFTLRRYSILSISLLPYYFLYDRFFVAFRSSELFPIRPALAVVPQRRTEFFCLYILYTYDISYSSGTLAATYTDHSTILPRNRNHTLKKNLDLTIKIIAHYFHSSTINLLDWQLKEDLNGVYTSTKKNKTLTGHFGLLVSDYYIRFSWDVTY